MASLTHVCMWSDNGWKRITAEQASRLHPGGTVSAHSGLFMLDSVFSKNVDLYLKLAEKTLDTDARSKLQERMESIKFERARKASSSLSI